MMHFDFFILITDPFEPLVQPTQDGFDLTKSIALTIIHISYGALWIYGLYRILFERVLNGVITVVAGTLVYMLVYFAISTV